MEENHIDNMDVDGEKTDIEIASNVSVFDSEEDIKYSDSDDEAQEAELNNKKLKLQERIQNDKTDYYAYVELIQVLSSLGELYELRTIRETFNNEYPLNPEMWLSWIDDEKKLVTTIEEKEHVKNLFERALKDYLSVDIWLEYVQFSIGLMSDGNQVESVRCILERALAICGYHVSKGVALWEVYIEFEKIILASLMKPNEEEKEESQKKIYDQKRRIGEIFRRQLSVPLLHMEKTYQELKLWLDEEQETGKLLDIDSLENSYKKALEKLSKILTFEDSLLCCESDANLKLYRPYLEYEKNPKEGGNDPFRVRCLYERALTDNPLNKYLWCDYIQYISDVIKIPEDVMSVAYRAIRNCPNELNFWCQYMILLECYNKPKSEITNLLNKGLQTELANADDKKKLWLSYVLYLRRQLNSVSKEEADKWENTIEEIREVLAMAFKNYFGLDDDPECELLIWWARFEAETAKNLENFRKIWTDILNYGHNKSSTYWIKYINMEWQYGDAKHMRRLCSRALAAVTDSPRSIADLWLEYESHVGSLDSFRQCRKSCDERMKKYTEEKKTTKEKYRFDDKKKKIQPEKKVKEHSHPKTNEKEQKSSGKFGNLVPKAESVPKQWKKPATATKGTSDPHDPSKPSRTIFVSNLDYAVTEEDVKKVLGSVGKITECTLIKDYKGRSKGFGYLVFSSKEEVSKALKLDRTPINQRPVYISECQQDKESRRTGLRFSTGMEKNKLFIKGLPFTFDKDGIEKLFSQFGPIKEVRLVTYRNGHSKGLAYVEFEDEVSAANALLKTDGSMVIDKTISVSISNPPERKNYSTSTSLAGDSIANNALGAGTGDKNEFGIRGRGRTQLSFVPRALQVDVRNENKNNSISDKPPVNMEVSENQPENTDKKAMSNADFRSMLLGKK